MIGEMGVASLIGAGCRRSFERMCLCFIHNCATFEGNYCFGNISE